MLPPVQTCWTGNLAKLKSLKSPRSAWRIMIPGAQKTWGWLSAWKTCRKMIIFDVFFRLKFVKQKIFLAIQPPSWSELENKTALRCTTLASIKDPHPKAPWSGFGQAASNTMKPWKLTIVNFRPCLISQTCQLKNRSTLHFANCISDGFTSTLHVHFGSMLWKMRRLGQRMNHPTPKPLKSSLCFKHKCKYIDR